MASDKHLDAEWKRIQKKTFTRWCNEHIKVQNMRIDDLSTDLSDGVRLIILLEVLSQKKLGRYNKKPRVHAQRMENVQLALDFIMKKERIRLVNIGEESFWWVWYVGSPCSLCTSKEIYTRRSFQSWSIKKMQTRFLFFPPFFSLTGSGDIVNGNLKLILGLIWTLILHYQISIGFGLDSQKGKDGPTPKQALMSYLQVQSCNKDYAILPFMAFTTTIKDPHRPQVGVEFVEFPFLHSLPTTLVSQVAHSHATCLVNR